MQQDILSGTLEIVLIVFSIVLFLLWFLLPFAVFGIKGKLDQLIQQNKQLISLLHNNQTEPVASSNGAPKKGIKVEPTITQLPKVDNTATGKMESE